MAMKLSELEANAYALLVKKAPGEASIDDLIVACYKAPHRPPHNARGSMTSIMRSLIEKAPILKLDFLIMRASPIGPTLGRYRAIRRARSRDFTRGKAQARG